MHGVLFDTDLTSIHFYYVALSKISTLRSNVGSYCPFYFGLLVCNIYLMNKARLVNRFQDIVKIGSDYTSLLLVHVTLIVNSNYRNGDIIPARFVGFNVGFIVGQESQQGQHRVPAFLQ